jgi:hypothetical protein
MTLALIYRASKSKYVKKCFCIVIYLALVVAVRAVTNFVPEKVIHRLALANIVKKSSTSIAPQAKAVAHLQNLPAIAATYYVFGTEWFR